MRKVLVTGASGFVGGHVVQALRSRGFAVRCLVRPASRLEFIRPADPEFVFGDVTEPSALDQALEGISAVVHCAGLTRAPSSREFFRVNEGGTRNLLSACIRHKHGLKAIVHVSSLAAIGPSMDGRPVTENTDPHPVSDYGRSKLAAQCLAESFRNELPIRIVVPPAVYGPRDTEFHAYFKLISWGFMPRIGSETRRISLIYVEDLAGAIATALENVRASGKTYLVDDGCVQTWTSVGREIGIALDRKPRSFQIPAALFKGVGAIGDLGARLTGKTWLLDSQKVQELMQKAWTCCSRRIREELAFHPQYSLEQGIRKTLAWYRENRWL